MIKNIILNNKLILLTVITGAFLRLDGIHNQGLNWYDSAYYANVAKVPILSFKWLFDENNSKKDLPSLETYLINRGCNTNIIKPGHVAFITLSFLIFGIKDYAVLLVSAICGIGVIVMTYRIGREIFAKSVGLIAAAIIAVSGQQIIFSRTGFPQTDTVFLFCLALFLFWKSICAKDGNKLFISSAVITGLTLLFHQSVYILIFLLFIAMMVNVNEGVNRSFSSRIKKCLYFFAIMLIPFIFSHIFITVFNSINPSGGEDLLMRNLERLQSGAFERWGISIEKLSFYPSMFWMLEGPLVTMLIPLSIIFMLWKAYNTHSINYVLIGLLASIPLVFWTLNYTTLKAIQVAMPFVAISIGVFIVALSKRISIYYNKKKIGFYIQNITILFILIIGTNNSFTSINLKTNYNSVFIELEKYMKANDGQLNAIQNNIWPITYFYAGNIVDNNPSQFSNNIIFDKPDAHSDYRIIDWQQFQYGKNDINSLMDVDNKYSPVIQKIYWDEAIPILNYHRHYDVKSVQNLFKKYPQTHFISVYDLRNKRIIDK